MPHQRVRSAAVAVAPALVALVGVPLAPAAADGGLQVTLVAARNNRILQLDL